VHDVLGYRATLLPGASTWLFLRVLHQMNVTPSLALLERAAMVVLGCLAAGLQVGVGCQCLPAACCRNACVHCPACS
jgi:hypothetical protein